MSKVSVTLNGRAFTIGCEEGQEAYLRDLASYVDGKVSVMSGQVGQIGDLRLLLMASLMVVDELKESERRIESLEAHVDRLRNETRGAASLRSEERDGVAACLIAAAERLEGLVQTLEASENEPPSDVALADGKTDPETQFAEAGA
jgi:cell division protein ZapA